MHECSRVMTSLWVTCLKSNSYITPSVMMMMTHKTFGKKEVGEDQTTCKNCKRTSRQKRKTEKWDEKRKRQLWERTSAHEKAGNEEHSSVCAQMSRAHPTSCLLVYAWGRCSLSCRGYHLTDGEDPVWRTINIHYLWPWQPITSIHYLGSNLS